MALCSNVVEKKMVEVRRKKADFFTLHFPLISTESETDASKWCPGATWAMVHSREGHNRGD